jgi:Big-like domain-containing protein
MQSRLSARSRASALLGALALLTACSSSTPQTPTPTPAPQVASLAISVANPTLAKGTLLTLTAKALYDDQSLKDVTELATWSSADARTIGIEDCRARGLAQGTAVVSVAFGGKNASTALTVTAAELVSIAIAPVAPVAKGLTRALTVTGTFTDGTTQDLTAQAAWSSSAPDVAGVVSGLLQARAAGAATVHAIVVGPNQLARSADVAVTVSPATATAIVIDQPSFHVVEKLSKPLTVSGTFTDGSHQDVSGEIAWSSSNEAVLTISNGTVRAKAAGEAQVVATMGGLTAKVQVVVDAAQLASLQIGAVANLPKGLRVDLRVTGTYDNDTQKDLSPDVLWTSSDEGVAVVSSAGQVTAIAPGEVTLTAKASGSSASLKLSVTPAVVVGIEVAPAAATVPAGLEKPFTAMATFSDGTKADVTSMVTWQTSDEQKATISNVSGKAGLLSALRAGQVDVVAMDPATKVRGSASFTVSAAALVKIAIDPVLQPELPVGLARQLKATGVFSDDSVQDITKAVVWTSSNDAAASIVHVGGDAGIASGIAPGATTIRAESADGHLGTSVQLTVVGAVIVKLDATCGEASIAKGYATVCTATGTFSDHSQRPVTAAVTWTSENPEIAKVEGGLVWTSKESQVGTATIDAVVAPPLASERLVAKVAIEVTDAVLTDIVVGPVMAFKAMPRWYPIPFQATGLFSDMTSQDLTSSATWSVSDASIATVSNVDAVVRGQQAGRVDVLAAKDGVVGRYQLVIANWDLARLVVAPAATSIAKGYAVQFTATGEYVDPGSEGGVAMRLDFTQLVSWLTHDWPGTDAAVAGISNAAGSRGSASALAVGTTTVHAVDPVTGRCAEARLDVTPAVVTALRAMVPGAAIVHKGQTQQYAVEGVFSDGTTADVSRMVAWASSVPAVATVDANGLARATGWGSAALTATLGELSSSGKIEVPAMTQLEITPSGASLVKGLYLEEPLQVTAVYSDGVRVDVTSVAALSSSDVGVVRLDALRAFGAGVGTATVTASVGELSAKARVDVTPARLISVRIVSDALQLVVGHNSALRAIGTFTDGDREITSAVVWDSSASAIAQVSNDLRDRGTVTAMQAGQTAITAIDPETHVYGSATILVVPAFR